MSRPAHVYEAGFTCRVPAPRCGSWGKETDATRRAACSGCQRCYWCSDRNGCPRPKAEDGGEAA